MRQFLRICCLLALSTLLATDVFAQRKVQHRRALVPAGFVRIFVPQGDVTVVGWDRDSLAVSGTVDETAGGQFALNITKQGAKLGFWDGSGDDARPASLTVYVPRNSQLWVKTVGANISVRALTGSLDLMSVSGSIAVAGAPRNIYAETMAGGIELNDVRTPVARVKTASGTIKASGHVNDLTAVSVSGDINIATASFGRARFESVEGQIRYYGGISPAAVLDIVNHAGAITLVIPAATAAEFAFNLYDAELTDEFGIKKRWMMSNKMKAREMTFGLGDRPTARITIRSFKGQVAIRRQDAGVK